MQPACRGMTMPRSETYAYLILTQTLPNGPSKSAFDSDSDSGDSRIKDFEEKSYRIAHEAAVRAVA